MSVYTIKGLRREHPENMRSELGLEPRHPRLGLLRQQPRYVWLTLCQKPKPTPPSYRHKKAHECILMLCHTLSSSGSGLAKA